MTASPGSGSTTRLLHVGCGDRRLPGFVNLDAAGQAADVLCDVRRGLPFPPDSIAGIFAEHFLEHLTVEEAVAFLRECVRVLVAGGWLRLATPDLDQVLRQCAGDWRDQDWIRQFHCGWSPNRCHMLNVVMRGWGHQWVYDEAELRRVANQAGLIRGRRCRFGQSEQPSFVGLEYRTDSLILEFQKPPTDSPVSILIPAYHARYFQAALDSALAQTYLHTEIIVCDDGPTEAIGQMAAACSDPRLHYERNAARLGSRGNYLRCFERAQGEFIKFLNDDDILAPDCVARMVAVLKTQPDVTLVTSHRQCIDAEGTLLPPVDATRRMVDRDMVLDGRSAVETMLTLGSNFIGEPTTTLFRRRDADALPDFMSFGGVAATWLVDMVVWTHLLSRGNLAFLTEPLSSFRIHAGQEQQQPGAHERGVVALEQLRAAWVARGGQLPTRPEIRGRPLDLATHAGQASKLVGGRPSC